MSVLSSVLVFFLACGAEPTETPEPPPAPEPAAEPAPAPAQGGGKAQSVDCDATGYSLGGKVGDKILVKCPSGCDSGSVWGDGRYTPDSRICRAAVHSGAIPASGGKAMVQFKEKFGPFEAADKNGVKSSAWTTPYEPSLVIKGKKKK
jgi:hypothetical protein